MSLPTDGTVCTGVHSLLVFFEKSPGNKLNIMQLQRKNEIMM